ERALDLERADAVAGRDDHVVRAADEPEVAVVVAAGAIAGQIPLAAPARGRSGRIFPVLEEERRRLPAQRQVADLAGRKLGAVLSDDAQVVPREGLPHGPRSDRERRQIAGQDDALGLAVAVVDEPTEGVVPGVDHLRIERLAGGGAMAETRQPAAAEILR